MSQWCAVLRTRGPKWDHSRPLREQALWDEHAAFTDGLEADGVIRLAGPLDGSDQVLMIMRGPPGEIERRLAEDPWPSEVLRITWIRPWNVLVGALD
jgi:hypothetical protein